MNPVRTLMLMTCVMVLSACKQPLAIQGEGDIVELNRGERGCALEEFRAGWPRCTDNDVFDSESLRYRALPRQGWKFSRWDGNCAANSPGQDCQKNYDKKWVQWWDDNYPDEVLPPLTAVFVPDSNAPAAVPYIASQFGAAGRVGFAALLDALFSADGNYRFTSQQAATRNYFDRTPASFQRQNTSLLLTGPDKSALVPGGGALIVINQRLTGANQAAMSYKVSADGTTTVDYAGARLAGSLSPDGSVFTATQISPTVQGAAICLRTSSNKMVGNVAGSYYGAWISTQPVTAVTELLLDKMGQTAETALRDSSGGRNYSLGRNFMLVKATGQIETRDADGAVSQDGRVLFIIQTDPNKFPTLIVYVRKT